MTLASQQYANLVEHSYDRDGQMRDFVNKEIELEGVRYKILHFVDNMRTGYQGTVYQHLGSGDIVVAHRGTEFERQRWDDLIKTDGAMVLTRANLQADDAVALTRWARDYAEKQGQLPGKRTPEVTVTGHSLDGTSSGQSTKMAARREEKRKCVAMGGVNCKPAYEYKNSCAVVAERVDAAGKSIAYYQNGKDVGEASNLAISRCAAMNGRACESITRTALIQCWSTRAGHA